MADYVGQNPLGPTTAHYPTACFGDIYRHSTICTPLFHCPIIWDGKVTPARRVLEEVFLDPCYVRVERSTRLEWMGYDQVA